MNLRKTVTATAVSIVIILLAGCFPDTPVESAPVKDMQQGEQNVDADVADDIVAEDNENTDAPIRPTKEEVLAKREQVLEGMEYKEIKRLTENIKVANLTMEEAYLYDDLFGKLEDKEHLYWNYFDEKEEIQIGTEDDGTPITTYNRFDAANFMDLMREMKELVHNEKLRNDLQYIIDETKLAVETHEMEHANNIYKALHDMDYFLLRYGMDDVGEYVQDKAVVAKYYGVLGVYAE